MSLKGECQPDSELLAGLTSETGPLAAGALPALDMGTTDGVKNMCESLAGGNVVKAKKKTTKTTEQSEEVTPATPKERLDLKPLYFLIKLTKQMLG